nr:GAF domain-containing protein [Ornithinimicrobium flavum]
MSLPDVAERYLELLAEDRPVEDLEGLLRRELDAGADEGALVRVHDLALRVHSLRQTGRRRESELVALHETVSDLAALKDLDDVLEAIVRRARTLLGADVSYLSLNDDDAGHTYMRVTQGIHSEQFRHVRLDFGEGLGGLVAQTARPYATADYFNDARFFHTRKVDTAVRGEELNAIVAVPLLLGRTVIGVLYAANHDHRGFGREDINLLSSFAGHAALAIDNARRTQESAAAVADLQEAGELLRRSAEQSQRAADAHDRLAHVVLQGGDLSDVAKELGEVLGEPVLVLDAQGATLATSDPAWEPGPAGADLVAQALRDNRTHVGDGLSVSPVWAGGAPMAAVLMDSEVDNLNRRILERAAGTAALIMAVQRNVAETESRMRGDLLVDLLLGRAGRGRWRRAPACSASTSPGRTRWSWPPGRTRWRSSGPRTTPPQVGACAPRSGTAWSWCCPGRTPSGPAGMSSTARAVPPRTPGRARDAPAGPSDGRPSPPVSPAPSPEWRGSGPRTTRRPAAWRRCCRSAAGARWPTPPRSGSSACSSVAVPPRTT